MNKAFEKIFEKLEELQNNLLSQTEGDVSLQVGIINGVMYSKKIVQEVAEEYNDGWIDELLEAKKNCGEDSDCSKCPFGQIEDRCILTELQIANNNKGGWIPCSERLPEERDWCLAVFEEVDTGFIGIPYIADYLMGSHTKFTTEDGWIIRNCSDREDESAEYYKNLLRCVAWQPLPEPFKERD